LTNYSISLGTGVKDSDARGGAQSDPQLACTNIIAWPCPSMTRGCRLIDV